MIVQGFVFKLFGWNNEGGPLDNGVKEYWDDQFKEILSSRKTGQGRYTTGSGKFG